MTDFSWGGCDSTWTENASYRVRGNVGYWLWIQPVASGPSAPGQSARYLHIWGITPTWSGVYHLIWGISPLHPFSRLKHSETAC